MPRSILLLVLVMAIPVSRAESALSIKAQAAWNGLIKAGTTSEIVVTLLADRGGEVVVTVPDHHPQLRVTTRLNARLPHTLWLTVRPEVDKTLSVHARMHDGAESVATVRFELARQETHLVASALNPQSDLPSRFAGDTLFFVAVGGNMLPHSEGGYGGIDALILDSDTLPRLDLLQFTVLQDYGAGCGRITLLGPATPRYDQLIAAAGCGGRFTTRVTNNESVLPTLRAMLGSAISALPSANGLRAMSKFDMFAGTWRALSLFFAIYVVGLVVITRSPRTWIPLLLAPVCAALVAWAAWSNNSAERRLISWSEIDTHGHTSRYSALLQISGNGKGAARTRLPNDLGFLQPQGTDPIAELDRSDADASRIVLKSSNRLLSQHSYFIQGNSDVDPPITVTMTDRGPRIENRGSTVSTPALLGWNDRRTPVPALQPGESWYAPDTSTSWNVALAEERMLRARTQTGTAALLLPHRLLSAGEDEALQIEEHGWLMIISG